MDDLWGILPSTTTAADAPPPSSLSTDSARVPATLIEKEISQENVIANMIPQVAQICLWSDQLCEAAWELSNYVPPDLSANEGRSNLWKNMLIPKMAQALSDDIRARNELERSLSSILVLATAVNQSAGLIRDTRGSEHSITVARQTVKSRLQDLDNCIKSLQTLGNAAIAMFQQHAQDILQIVGESAANFATQEAECQDIIDKLNQKARNLLAERAEAVAVIEKYNNLVHAQSAHVNGAQAALSQTRERQQQLNGLISYGEQAINAIPDTVTRTSHHRAGFWFWRRSWTTTTQVKNPDKEAMANYYTGIINARNARLKEASAGEDKARDLVKEQERELANYSEALKKAQETLQGINTRLGPELDEINRGIAVEVQKINAIRNQADQTENLIGMKGSVLISCLAAIRNFSKAQKGHACLYQPLISVLEYVKSLSEQSVAMLDGDRGDVFAGGVRLVKQVGFFTATHNNLRQVTASTEERQHVLEQFKQKRIEGNLNSA